MSQINLRTLLSKTVSAIKEQLDISSFKWSEFETKLSEAMKKDTGLLIALIEGDEATLENIVIPPGTKKIKAELFSGNTAIKSVVIPSSVEEIGATAFNCPNLETITIEGANIRSCSNAFAGKAIENSKVLLTGGTNNDYLSYIGKNLIGSYIWTEGIDIPIKEGIENITKWSIKYYKSSAGKLIIPNSVKYIRSYAIEPDNNTAGSYDFYGSIKIGTGIIKIEKYAFNINGFKKGVYAEDLAAWCRIDFEDKTSNPCYSKKYNTSIDFYLNDTKVEKLVIPQGVSEIKNYAFYNTSFSEVTILSSVTSIGVECFGGSASGSVKDKVTFLNRTNIPTLAEGGDLNATTIEVPSALLSQWKAAPNWSNYSGRIVGI